jgi:hypothetical protein
MAWTFLDYVDEQGRNQVRAWIDSLPPSDRVKAESKLDATLLSLIEASQLEPPQVKPWVGSPGILELRFSVGRIAYRPLMAYRPPAREVVILIGAKEVNDRIVPASAPARASERRQVILNDHRRAVPHDYR